MAESQKGKHKTVGTISQLPNASVLNSASRTVSPRSAAKGGGPVTQTNRTTHAVYAPDRKTVAIAGITVPVYDCPPEWRFLIPDEQEYEPVGSELLALAASYKHQMHQMFIGPAGSGKNALVRYFAHLVQRPLFLISIAEGTGIDQFIGSVVPVPAKDGHGFSVEFRYGALPLAIKAGGILVLDEITAGDERALMRLHDFLATGDRLTIYEDPSNDGKYISPYDANGVHNGFMVVATGNPPDTGQYAGTKVLNEATLDRFNVYESDYLGLSHPDREVAMVASMTGVNESKVRRIANVFNVIRKRTRMSEAELAKAGAIPIYATASTRRLIAVAKLSRDVPIMRAVEFGYTNKLNRDDRPVVHKLFLDEFGSDGAA